ncbi:MAG TPA: serine hydrolase [Steroidobacteraceae bacterium]|jgi:CubicO group peptidase (beta-lactamase class C family)
MKSVAAFVALLLLGSTAAIAQDDELLGLWASETTFAPALQGELTLKRAGESWRASIGGAEAPCTVENGSMRCAFSNNRGYYRGPLTKGEPHAGWWVRPSGETQDRRDPGGSGQSFAGRVELRSSGAGEWRGSVQPLEDRFNLYLRISRNDQGERVGAFRNPDLNSYGGASYFIVSRDGEAVHFYRRAPDGTEIRQEATLARAPDRLKIFWKDLGMALELTRREPAQVAAFPRPPGEPKYVYRKPPDLGDGWATAAARDVGLDDAVLTRLVQQLIDTDPFVRGAPLIHSLLVARRGKLVLEEYFFGYARDTPHDTRSAGKTFSSIMLGAAMLQGAKVSAQTPIYELLAARGPFANPDPRKAHITLAHLMTHTSGLDCDDNNSDSPGNEQTMTTQRAQPDWWKYTLDLRQVYDPGTHYAYCSANTNLVGGALTTATRTWLPELFDRSVAQPLQFGRYYWNISANGEGYQGGGAFVRPRDLLKIGQLYLDGGTWHGQRIVSPEWVAASTAQYIEITPATTGLSAEEFPNYYSLGADGLTWHLGKLQVADRVYQEYLATGNGGQLVIVVPEAQLAVAITAGNYMQGGIWGRWPQEIVGKEIIAEAAR